MEDKEHPPPLWLMLLLDGAIFGSMLAAFIVLSSEQRPIKEVPLIPLITCPAPVPINQQCTKWMFDSNFNEVKSTICKGKK